VTDFGDPTCSPITSAGTPLSRSDSPDVSQSPDPGGPVLRRPARGCSKDWGRLLAAQRQGNGLPMPREAVVTPWGRRSITSVDRFRPPGSMAADDSIPPTGGTPLPLPPGGWVVFPSATKRKR